MRDVAPFSLRDIFDKPKTFKFNDHALRSGAR